MINFRNRILFMQSSEEKKSIVYNHLRLLIAVAEVDKQKSEVEMNYIKKVADRHGVSPTKLKELYAEEKHQLCVPEKIEDRFSLLYDVIKIIQLDGMASPQEMEFCYSLYRKMFGTAKTKEYDLVWAISSNIINGNDKEETFNRVSILLKSKMVKAA